MKLRNKKTGKIGELHFEPDKEYHFTVATEDPADMMIFKTLAELNEDWEDYEEPKGYWFINTNIHSIGPVGEDYDGKEKDKEIGNYFATKEEAEKAVEKLKAWKRLKDAGFGFKGFDWRDRGTIGDYEIYARVEGEVCSLDLNLLFGGEE